MIEDWQRTKELFFAALEAPTGEREAFVSAATEGEPVLRETVLGMLAQHGRGEEGLEIVAEEPLYPEKIGPYRTSGIVARTETSVVLRGEREDGQFEQSVAIKLLQPMGRGSRARWRFETERHVLAALRHPNLCRMLDAGTLADGTPYLVLEWIDGVPLTVAGRELEVRERLRLFLEACSAVEAAHRMLVIHRDLKPAHVLVTPAGDVKILDFGIAKLISHEGDRDGMATIYGQTPLTPAYASPEQWRGESATAAMDVFGLGVLLFELLAQAHPFGPAPASPQEWAERIGRGEAKDLGKCDPQFRGDLAAISRKALAHEVGERYRSVEALRRDIENFLADRPIESRRWELRHSVHLWVRRNWQIAAPLLVVLGLLLFVAVREWRLRSERMQSAEVSRQHVEALMRETLETLIHSSVPREGRQRILNLATKQLEEIERAGLPEQEELKVAKLYLEIGAQMGESFANHTGDLLEGRRIAQRGLALLRRNSARTGSPAALEPLMNGLVLLGDIYYGQKDWQAAFDAYGESITLMEKELAPRGKDIELMWSVSRSMQGDCLLQMNRAAEALQIQEQVLERREQLTSRPGWSDDRPASHYLGGAQLSISQAQAALGRSEEAMRRAQEAVRLFRASQEAKGESRKLDDAYSLVDALRHLGELQWKSGLRGEAKRHWQEAISVIAQLQESDPGSPHWQRLLEEYRELLRRN